MTTALYRRYRPDTFASVIGQDHVTEPLRAALRANRVTHAYLFSGPRGCGKTTSARILARCLNCAEGPTDAPCGQCDSCRELATGGPGSLDVVEMDAASHGGVDDARDLRERATFAPVRDRYKVFIIDEAHMVTSSGFNALLKIVEEPPEHVKFIFATTEPDKVIGTIRSRTHHYPFRLVPPDVLEPYLASLCDEEGIGAGEGVLPLVMRAGGGSVRDTLSVLDQLMAGAIDSEVSYSTAVALLGYTDSALLDASVDALAGGDGAAAYRVVERMVESGHDPRRFVEDLLQRLRDLLIIAVAGDGAADVLSGTPSDQLERMRVQAKNWGPRALSRAADLVDEALRQMTGATSPRLQLELLIGRILVPANASLPAREAGVEGAPMPGTVGMTGGGAPHEGAASGRHFGAREAREALERSQNFRGAGEQSASADQQSQRAPAPPAEHPRPQEAPRPADVGWPDVASPQQPGGRAADDRRSAPEEQRPAQPQELAARVQEPAPAEPPTASAPSAPHGQAADLLRGRWDEVVNRLSTISRMTWALIGPNSQLGAVDGSTVVLLFPTPGLLANFERGPRAAHVVEAIYEVTGLQVEVRAEVGQSSGGQSVTAPSASASGDEPTQWVSEPPPFDEPDAGPREARRPEPTRAEPSVNHVSAPSNPEPASTDSGWPPIATPMNAAPAARPDPESARVSNAVPESANAPDLDSESALAAPARPILSRDSQGRPRAVSVFTYDDDPIEPPTTAVDAPTATSSPAESGAVIESGPVFDDRPEPAPTDVPRGPAVSGWTEAVASPGGAPFGSSVSFDDASSSPSSPVNSNDDAEPEPEPGIEDTPSIDDEDIEVSTRFGVPAVLDILGGAIIEERRDEGTY